MPAAVSSSQKSTTVRSQALAVAAYRAAFGVLSRVAPRTAERRAARLFFRPRGSRVARPPRVEGLGAAPFDVRHDGGTLAAWSFGQGPAVLLVHGWEGHAGQLAAFVAPLVASGHRVVAFDLPAHGGSSGEETDLFRAAAAVRAVAASVGGARAVIGHSFGGAATAIAIGAGLAAERAVLLASSSEGTLFARRAAQLLGLSGARATGMLMEIGAIAGRPLDQARVALHVAAAHAPALLLHDPADAEVPFHQAEEIAAAWPGARLEAVTGVGHRRILRSPEVVRRAVEFVGPARAP
jgi:pimeloyl-ACP methyl ester carboxylesterase